jgi:hypothetical protein
MSRPARVHATSRPATLVLPTLAVLAVALAVRPAPAANAKAPDKAAAHATPAPHPAAASAMGAISLLPGWTPPASYSVDMVITHGKDHIVMTRHVDGTKVRTDIAGAGADVSMIELGDEAGTTWTLIPKEKQAIRQSSVAMEKMMKSMPGARSASAAPEAAAQAPADVKVELVGHETLAGRAADKYKATSAEGTAFAWVDPETKAPLRMESDQSVIEWRNFTPAPQPAALFAAPKGYEVMDMDEMMKSMSSMKVPGGMPGMAGMAGMGGVGGMAGGMSLNGMAGQFGQNMGSQFGATFGATLGASLGGPIGSMAGSYLGGKIGGMIGHKAATAVTPGH